MASVLNFSRTVDDADAKCIDTGTLDGRVTCTVNVTIQPMGLMESLALSRSFKPTKRRVGLFKSDILKSDIDGMK